MPPQPSRSIGDWSSIRHSGILRRGDEDVRLTLQQTQLLEVLIDHAGEVVSKDRLFDEVWKGAAVEDNALPRCVSELRRILGDDARSPRYIETLPKRGYRWIAPVEVVTDPSQAPDAGTAVDLPSPEPSAESLARRTPRRLAVAGLVVAAVALGLWTSGRARTGPDPEAPRPQDNAEISAELEAVQSAHHDPEAEALRRRARAAVSAGIAAAESRDFDSAEQAFQEALARYQELDDAAAAATQRVNLARLHILRGEWAEAAEDLTRAEPVLATEGDDRQYAFLSFNLGLAHSVMGNLHLARHPLERAAESFLRLDQPLQAANAMTFLGEILVDLDEVDQALETLDEALELRQAHGDDQRIAHTRVALAHAWVEAGEPDTAIRVADAVLGLEGSYATQRVLAERLVAAAHLLAGRTGEARATIDRATERLKSTTEIAADALVRYWLPITTARIEIAERRTAEAEARLLNVLAELEGRDLRLVEAETRLVLAEAELAAGAIDQASKRLADLLVEADAAGWRRVASKAARASAQAITAASSFGDRQDENPGRPRSR